MLVVYNIPYRRVPRLAALGRERRASKGILHTIMLAATESDILNEIFQNFKYPATRQELFQFYKGRHPRSIRNVIFQKLRIPKHVYKKGTLHAFIIDYI